MSDQQDIRNESFGVFKPVGHVVATFADDGGASAAQDELHGLGLTSEATGLRRIAPAEMVRLADSEIANASPLAGFGYEINLIKAYRKLAEDGAHFLVIRAKEDEEVQQVASIVQRHGAEQAQRFGRLKIDELIERPAAERAVPRPDFGSNAA
ncbi:MAG: hypothetical protein IPM15_20655 [Betaproteobacteria bacterium]|nr:hypothetical protein [Betaproteobacteria bacterium]MCC6248709.1 hypothetical protein [Rubrivivax sp.]